MIYKGVVFVVDGVICVCNWGCVSFVIVDSVVDFCDFVEILSKIVGSMDNILVFIWSYKNLVCRYRFVGNLENRISGIRRNDVFLV